MNIKAVLSDLDGTLIDFEGNYHKDIPLLIKKIQEKNISFSLATGRSRVGKVDELIKELNLSPMHIVCGGGMILNWKTGEIPLHQTISHYSVKKIVDYFLRSHVVFCLETHDEVYMHRSGDVPLFIEGIKIKEYSKETIPSRIIKILLFAATNKTSENDIRKHIENIAHFCADVELNKFKIKDYFGLDITSEGSTKHTAVFKYAEILGISRSEMIAIGDGHNDYPLFTACGYRIAMGNAPQELKDIADKVVGTAEEGGMREALEHIIAIS
jgi:Cof subfamily protein (haloacid dehalogenase superfamily)